MTHVTLEQARRLKESGYPQEEASMFRCIDKTDGIERLFSFGKSWCVQDGSDWCAAPDVEELMEFVRNKIAIRLTCDSKGFEVEIETDISPIIEKLDPNSTTKFLDILFYCAMWVLEKDKAVSS